MVERVPKNRVARWMMQAGERARAGRVARAARRATPRPRPPIPTWLRWTMAWGVHLYTAMGLVCAAGIAALLVRGDAEAFRWSLVLMLVATVIDATDGTLARRVKVKEVLPGFDGRRLDDITDFLTYTFLPLMLIWRAGLLPPGQEAWLLVPLIASAYGFCQVSIKTDDGYFLGFPSLWNVVAFYVYVLQFPAPVTLALLVGLGLLTFVPSRYLYPSSRPGPLNRISNVLGAAWCVLLAYVCLRIPGIVATPGDRVAKVVAWASLSYPIYYFAASWAISARIWLRGRARPAL